MVSVRTLISIVYAHLLLAKRAEARTNHLSLPLTRVEHTDEVEAVVAVRLAPNRAPLTVVGLTGTFVYLPWAVGRLFAESLSAAGDAALWPHPARRYADRAYYPLTRMKPLNGLLVMHGKPNRAWAWRA